MLVGPSVSEKLIEAGKLALGELSYESWAIARASNYTTEDDEKAQHAIDEAVQELPTTNQVMGHSRFSKCSQMQAGDARDPCRALASCLC